METCRRYCRERSQSVGKAGTETRKQWVSGPRRHNLAFHPLVIPAITVPEALAGCWPVPLCYWRVCLAGQTTFGWHCRSDKPVATTPVHGHFFSPRHRPSLKQGKQFHAWASLIGCCLAWSVFDWLLCGWRQLTLCGPSRSWMDSGRVKRESMTGEAGTAAWAVEG